MTLKVNSKDSTKRDQFESRFAEICGAKYSVALANGMGAIHSSLASLELNPGDEIIVSPIANPSSILAIIAQNCMPIFADIDPKTGLITGDEIRKVLTLRTKAIIVTHFWGAPCDMDPITKLAQDNDLVVIEDCSNSLLALYKGKAVGILSHGGCFSFDGGLSVHGGGAVTTNSEGYRDMIRDFAYGLCAVEKEGFGRIYPYPGVDYRLSNIQSCFILSLLKELPGIIKRREELAKRLDEYLRGIEGLILPQHYQGTERVYWQYHFRIDTKLFHASLDEIKHAIQAEGLKSIECMRSYYMPEAIGFLSQYVCRLSTAGYTDRELQLGEEASLKETLKHGLRWRIFEPYARRTIARLDYADSDKVVHYGSDTCPKAKTYLENTLGWAFTDRYTIKDIMDISKIIKKVLDNYRR